MRFGLLTVKNLYRTGSLMIVSSKLSKYMLDLVGVQEFRWEGNGTKPVGDYTSFCGKADEKESPYR
jgi:hypothetical protein